MNTQPQPAVPQGWQFKRNEDGSVGIFAPPPKPGESQRTSHVVHPSQSPDLLELLGKLADQQAAAPTVPQGAAGFGAQALAAELAEAALKDDQDPEGHDISAGLFGPNVSEWLRKVAREYLAAPSQPAVPQGESKVAKTSLKPDYSWPTVEEYEKCSGFSVNDAFRIGWNMVRTTDTMLGIKPDAYPSREPAVPAEIDVRTILLAIVPGDGNGQEVYAKTVDDVVAKLTELSERLEAAESGLGRAAQEPVTLTLTDEDVANCVDVATNGLPFIGLMNVGRTPSAFSRRFADLLIAALREKEGK